MLSQAIKSSYSFFALIQYSFFKKLNTQAGFRYDKHSIKTIGEGIIDSSTYKPVINKTFENISYSAGATYNMNKQLLFRANIAAGFRAPSLAELTANGQHGIRYEMGNNNFADCVFV